MKERHDKIVRGLRKKVSRPSWVNSNWPRGYLDLSRRKEELLPASRIRLEDFVEN